MEVRLVPSGVEKALDADVWDDFAAGKADRVLLGHGIDFGLVHVRVLRAGLLRKAVAANAGHVFGIDVWALKVGRRLHFVDALVPVAQKVLEAVSTLAVHVQRALRLRLGVPVHALDGLRKARLLAVGRLRAVGAGLALVHGEAPIDGAVVGRDGNGVSAFSLRISLSFPARMPLLRTRVLPSLEMTPSPPGRWLVTT